MNESKIPFFVIGNEKKMFVVGEQGKMPMFVIEKGGKEEQEKKRPFIIREVTEQNCTSFPSLGETEEMRDTLEKTCKNEERMQDGNSNVVKARETDENRKDAPIANYRLAPIMKIVYINREGQEDEEKEKIRATVDITGEKPSEIEILTVDICNITRIISRKFSTAILNIEEPRADKKIEVNFRMKTKGIPVLKCYTEAGWQNISGKKIYLHDTAVLGADCKIETGLNLPRDIVSSCELSQIVEGALKLYGDEVTMATMFLYSFTGVMYRIFSEAGFTPHFLLFLNGKTGSMKTTLGKILYVQLCSDKHREHVRRIDADTVTSFERAIVKSGRDTITLIDDYCPAKTAQKKGDMINKLESIIRMVGDGSTKSRSNANLDDVQGEGVQGTVVLTGEIRGRGLSSNLRCLYCEMQRDKVDEKMVSWFQAHPSAYTTLIDAFTCYLAVNWEGLVQYIKNNFTSKRGMIAKKIRERRLIDSVVTLQLIAEIVEGFCTEYCRFEGQYAHEKFEKMKECVVVNAKYSQTISEEETPAITFIHAINDLMAMKKVKICKKNDYRVGDDWDGFDEGEFFYFVPERVYAKAQELFRSTGCYFPMDLRETVISLHEEGIIKTHSNGAGKRIFYARVALDGEHKYKFLKISKQIFSELREEQF